jgi:A/G-specific adenine glycosylase
VAVTVEKYKQITRSIEKWFSTEAQEFPWRCEDTPWGRLVSEFMAQQTQIARVAERWPFVMERFPTPDRLAKSDEQNILSLWQGLGYYRRAKHLKKAAEMIMDEFGGEVPDDVDALMQLPGVGKYTAGAIASIAFGSREPIVDANVHRVLCRLWNHKEEWAPSKWTWKIAEQLVKACNSPKVFNEGLMEFGAVICTPKSPACSDCPLQMNCSSYAKKTQDKVPPPKKSLQKKRVFHYAVVLQNGKKIAFERRADQGLWASMWQVPTIDSIEELSAKEVSVKLQLESPLIEMGIFEHVLSHRVVSFTVFSCKVGRDNRFSWFNQEAIKELPLASAQRKVLAVHCAT